MAAAEGIALLFETGNGTSQKLQRRRGEVQAGNGALRPPIGNQEKDGAEIRQTGAEYGERVAEQRQQEDQLKGDHDRLAQIDQVVPPAITAEGVGQFRGIVQGRRSEEHTSELQSLR